MGRYLGRCFNFQSSKDEKKHTKALEKRIEELEKEKREWLRREDHWENTRIAYHREIGELKTQLKRHSEGDVDAKSSNSHLRTPPGHANSSSESQLAPIKNRSEPTNDQISEQLTALIERLEIATHDLEAEQASNFELMQQLEQSKTEAIPTKNDEVANIPSALLSEKNSIIRHFQAELDSMAEKDPDNEALFDSLSQKITEYQMQIEELEGANSQLEADLQNLAEDKQALTEDKERLIRESYILHDKLVKSEQLRASGMSEVTIPPTNCKRRTRSDGSWMHKESHEEVASPSNGHSFYPKFPSPVNNSAQDSGHYSHESHTSLSTDKNTPPRHTPNLNDDTRATSQTPSTHA